MISLSSQHLVVERLLCWHIIRMRERGEDHAAQLVRTVPQQLLQGNIALDNSLGHIGKPDPNSSALKDGPEAGFTGSQGPFRAFAR